MRIHPVSRMSSLLLHHAVSLSKPLPLRLFPVSSTKPKSPGKFRFASRAYPTNLSASSGEIHVIVGPMFAGKTTALIHRVQLETEQGRRATMIKSDKDTRYGLDSIVSHDGTKMPCWALPNLAAFPAKVGQQTYDELDVIGIDEAQFFGDLYDFCRNAADQDGKTIIVAGLDGDYLRRRFGSVLDLIPLADSVTKLSARCGLCGQRACFTLRKTKDSETELIGGADVYMPVCRQHYVNGQIVVEAARIVSVAQTIDLSPHQHFILFVGLSPERSKKETNSAGFSFMWFWSG
ncbi:hypothetical protein J5N97_008368 [Dioscorea zingiberensis]|uniref:Thymidine kinase n=1 Tax=Dioscorea zingiberensis TaxID=325984 RepID=A0A9D5CVL4_9LILI|nr:hypothetical protein J5N97_008368 [Dioscorea zingiberensis]